MNLRPVKQLLDELVRYVEAPRGVAIFLTESIPSSASDLNWVAIMGATGVQCNDRFEHKIAGLQKSDPILDWLGMDGGHRRIIRWVSKPSPGAFAALHVPSATCTRPHSVIECGTFRPHSAFRRSINLRRD